MVGRCYFVAFRVDLSLRSPIIIIFRNRACVQTTEQSRTVEYSRPDFWRKIRYFWRKIWYEIQFGEKSGNSGEKSGENGEKFGIDAHHYYPQFTVQYKAHLERKGQFRGVVGHCRSYMRWVNSVSQGLKEHSCAGWVGEGCRISVD